MFQYLKEFLSALAIITAGMLAYTAFILLTSRIHPLVPLVAILAATAGFFAYEKVRESKLDREHRKP